MEQIGDQVAKEQGQITADGAPTVLKTKTMIACTVCAYACTFACHLFDGMPT
jgi:hypothetical protein